MKRALPGIVLLSCLGLALVGSSPRSEAQEKVSTSLAATLAPASGNALARFGSSVAATSSVVAVGAFGDQSVSIYERNQSGTNRWGLKRRFVAPDFNASFGDSVALSGSTLAVGALNGGEGGFGAVYIFDRNRKGAWSMTRKISGFQPLDFFGFASALDQDTLAVGAIATDAVYVFSRNQGGKNQWGLERVLAGPEGSNFGYSVAVSGNLVLVGTRLGNAAYLFGRNQGGTNQWGLIASLSPGESAPGFGKAVAISGTRAVVGAPDADGFAGAAYLFTRNQGGPNRWGVVKKFAQFGTDDFGGSVALSGDLLLIGARIASTQDGLVVFFARNWIGPDAWGGFSGIYNDDGSFGVAVAAAGDTAVVGQNEEGTGAGHAFVFRINP